MAGELLVAPGTKVNGTVLFASKAPHKYSRPRLVLDFSNIAHKDGQRTPLYARVLDVDNARETVRNLRLCCQGIPIEANSLEVFLVNDKRRYCVC